MRNQQGGTGNQQDRNRNQKNLGGNALGLKKIKKKPKDCTKSEGYEIDD